MEIINSQKRIVRDTKNKKIAGVCSGLAVYWKIDVVIVRILFVIAALIQGIGIVLYIVIWAVAPKADKQNIPTNTIQDTCPLCKNPNTKKLQVCEWCGGVIY